MFRVGDRQHAQLICDCVQARLRAIGIGLDVEPPTLRQGRRLVPPPPGDPAASWSAELIGLIHWLGHVLQRVAQVVQDRTLCDPLVHASGRSREAIFTDVKDAYTEDGREGAVRDGAVALLGPEAVRDDRCLCGNQKFG